MAAIDIGTEQVFKAGLDSVVIRHYGDGVKGGKVLDVSGFNEEFVQTGHIIIKDTATDVYKPMPVANGAFGALPNGCEYVGICVTTQPKEEPIVGIMTDGEVNDEAMPFTMSAAIKAAFKSAVPTIRFDHD